MSASVFSRRARARTDAASRRVAVCGASVADGAEALKLWTEILQTTLRRGGSGVCAGGVALEKVVRE